MNVEIIRCKQGTTEWLLHRARHLNASELSAAMGMSSYITRADFIKQKATGIAPEVDASTQYRFNKGHEFEAIARPWAEEIIGEELAPVVLAGDVDGLPLSASLDGQTIIGDVTWEHKSGNAALLSSLDAGVIPEEYHPQMEQGLMLSGASRCLFMASSGDRDAMRYAWYESNPGLRSQIVPIWKQVQADVASYVQEAPAAPTPTGRAPDALPALRIEVTGHVTASNLVEFREHALAVIAGINRDLQTDADFANAEQTVKWCASAEARLKAAKDAALAQTASIEEAFRVIDDVSAELRRTRLDLDKSVKAEKDNRRAEKVMAARSEFDKHVARLQLDIKGVRLIVPAPDFGGAIKGLSSLASIDEKLTAALIAGKAEANTIASLITNNLRTLDSVPAYAHLFADRQELAYKDAEVLELLMQKRVDAEQARIEAERERIRLEEERKAREAAEREAEAERQRIRAEEQAKAQAEAQAAREAQAQQAIQQAAEPAAAPAAPAPAPWDADEAATLKLGDVNARLTPIQVTADGLRELGIEPAGRDKRAVLYSESQFAGLCDAIARRAMEAKRAALLPA